MIAVFWSQSEVAVVYNVTDVLIVSSFVGVKFY